jgi:hypothetical protein
MSSVFCYFTYSFFLVFSFIIIVYINISYFHSTGGNKLDLYLPSLYANSINRLCGTTQPLAHSLLMLFNLPSGVLAKSPSQISLLFSLTQISTYSITPKLLQLVYKFSNEHLQRYLYYYPWFLCPYVIV